MRRFGSVPSKYACAEAAELCARRRMSGLPGSYVVLDGALTPEGSALLHEELVSLHDGPGKRLYFTYEPTGQPDARGDHKFHVNETDAARARCPQLSHAISLLKGIAHEIDQQGLSSTPEEPERQLQAGPPPQLTTNPRAQVACYPGDGTGYQKHQDNKALDVEGGDEAPTIAPEARASRDKEATNAASGTAAASYANWRMYTVILYANEGWTQKDGGCLRIYPGTTGVPAPVPPPPPPPHEETGTGASSHTASASDMRYDQQGQGGAPAFVDVEPLGGRVVVFDSLLEHEVLPSAANRYAVTLWVWREDGDRAKLMLS